MLRYTATADGTYYISAGGKGDSKGTYKVSVTDVTRPDDYTADTDTTGAVEVGGSASGWIYLPYDIDWFAVELEAGNSYWIDMKSKSYEDGGIGNTFLRGIFDSDGDRIYVSTDIYGLRKPTVNDNSDESGASLVIFTPSESGTYYVAAGGAHDSVGSYDLFVRKITDDYSGRTGTTGVVEVGGSVTGEIQLAGDRDWFAVELEAGKTYRFDLEGADTGAGTLPNTHLRGIYDAEGELIDGTMDVNGGVGNNSRVTYTATETGTYYVVASPFNATFWETNYPWEYGTYTLSVEEVM